MSDQQRRLRRLGRDRGALAASRPSPLTGIYHEPIDANQQLDFVAQRREAQAEDDNGKQPGNPELAAMALLETLSREDPPFRLLLGDVAYDVAVDRYEQRLAEFRAGEAVARGPDDR